MNAMRNEREAPSPIYVLINQHGRLMEDRSFVDAAEAARMAEAYSDFDDRFQVVEVAPVAQQPVQPTPEPAPPVQAVDEAMTEIACRAYYNSGVPVTPPVFEAMRAALTAALAHPRPTGEKETPVVTTVSYEHCKVPGQCDMPTVEYHGWVCGQGMNHKGPCIPSDAEEARMHDDRAAVAFSVAMREKLAAARAKDRSGWNDKADCSQQHLSDLLRNHVERGDPVDVANFAMFLHQRGESILPVPTVEQAGEVVTGEAVAEITRGPDNELNVSWLIEGGIDALIEGETLYILGMNCPEDGAVELYAAAAAAAPAPGRGGEA